MKKILMLSLILIVFLTITPFSNVSSQNIAYYQESPYKLPYPAGNEYKISQGNNTKREEGGSHYGLAKYAFDFNSQFDGKIVVASRQGKVLAIQDKFGKGKCDPEHGNDVNFILIDHEDGTSALYLHLQKDSITVKEGEDVKQGQIIGKANSSGYCCGAHLHFQVQRTPQNIWIDANGKKRGWYTQSIPVSFSDKDVLAKEKDAIPKTGKRYKSDNALLSYVSKIAYTIYNKKADRCEIWIINEDGTDKELFQEDACYPAFSPDGRKIAYVMGGEIRVAKADGSFDQIVFKKIREEIPIWLRWSSDGQGILFHLMECHGEGSSWPLYFLELSTLKTKKLSFRWGDIDKDGKTVFIKEEGEDGDPYEPSKKYRRQAWIIVADKDGGDPKQIFGPIGIKREELSEDEFREYWQLYEIQFHEGEQFIYHPSWSPKCKEISFWYLDIKSDELVLAIIDANGENFREIQRVRFKVLDSKDWSPDGKKIAYCYPDKSGYWIWIINSDGTGKPRRLVQGFGPSWTFAPVTP